jgi:hypothetical protein
MITKLKISLAKGYYIKQQDKYGECLWMFEDKEKADVFYEMMSRSTQKMHILRKEKGIKPTKKQAKNFIKLLKKNGEI